MCRQSVLLPARRSPMKRERSASDAPPPSRKRRRVRFTAPPSESQRESSHHHQQQEQQRQPHLYPYRPTDQWLQPSEQQAQRMEALQEASRLLSGEQKEHGFRECYQSIYQICHALAAREQQQEKRSDTAGDDGDFATKNKEGAAAATLLVLPKQVRVACTHLLASKHETRGLEDRLAPAVAWARRLERRHTIRAVLLLQKQQQQQQQQQQQRVRQQQQLDDAELMGSVARQLSLAHGKFAHALALADAATAMSIYQLQQQQTTGQKESSSVEKEREEAAAAAGAGGPLSPAALS